jgi:hypothetical protein
VDIHLQLRNTGTHIHHHNNIRLQREVTQDTRHNLHPHNMVVTLLQLRNTTATNSRHHHITMVLPLRKITALLPRNNTADRRLRLNRRSSLDTVLHRDTRSNIPPAQVAAKPCSLVSTISVSEVNCEDVSMM